jgi:hypothetical protein
LIVMFRPRFATAALRPHCVRRVRKTAVGFRPNAFRLHMLRPAAVPVSCIDLRGQPGVARHAQIIRSSTASTAMTRRLGDEGLGGASNGFSLFTPVDPSAFDSIGPGPRFPYWLSAPATQAFHAFFKTLDRAVLHGWSSFTGRDGKGTAYRLSCLYFNDNVLWGRTAIRRQDLVFSAL